MFYTCNSQRNVRILYYSNGLSANVSFKCKLVIINTITTSFVTDVSDIMAYWVYLHLLISPSALYTETLSTNLLHLGTREHCYRK